MVSLSYFTYSTSEVIQIHPSPQPVIPGQLAGWTIQIISGVFMEVVIPIITGWAEVGIKVQQPPNVSSTYFSLIISSGFFYTYMVLWHCNSPSCFKKDLLMLLFYTTCSNCWFIMFKLLCNCTLTTFICISNNLVVVMT